MATEVDYKHGDFLRALKFTLNWEGRYVDDPDDAGGATNFGITQKSYDLYRTQMHLPMRPVKDIDRNEVEECYYLNYWRRGYCFILPGPLAHAFFDTVVNFGVRGGVYKLQEALGVTVDGVIGPKTLGAIERGDPKMIALQLVNARKMHRYKRVSEKPSQYKFLRGWLNRDESLRVAVNRGDFLRS